MIEYLNKIDHQWFEYVQLNLRNIYLDPVFLALRDKFFWIPFYIFLMAWIQFKFKKTSWKLIVIIILTVTVTDQLNSNVFKKYFNRQRPCNELYFKDQFSPVIDCSGGLSFPSSHATNHMGIASFLFFTLGTYFGVLRWLLVVWALLIGFSQVYIGVHFPFDVLAGWLEGLLIGFLIYLVFKKFIFSENPAT